MRAFSSLFGQMPCAYFGAVRVGFSGTNGPDKKLFSFATSSSGQFVSAVCAARASQAVLGAKWLSLRASLYYGSASPMSNLRRPSSPSRPVYLRLRDHICDGILDGSFPEGTMLPSVRAFAAEQGANPLTVAKAYQQFQDEGYVTVQRGIGMFVAAGAVAALRLRERESFLTDEWPAIAVRLHLLGLKLSEMTELV